MSTAINYSTSSLGDDQLEEQFEARLRDWRASPPLEQGQFLGGETRRGGEIRTKEDPCEPSRVIASAFSATTADVHDAVAIAKAASASWRRASINKRVDLLREAGGQIESELVDLAALVSAETGKSRLEALGEAQEVIDMITYYTGEMVRNNGYEVPLASRENERSYDILRPYGTFAVIAPFNFPVALTIGMAVGAVLTGNTAIVKPSDKTPGSTATVVRALAEHLPAGVLNIIHGGAHTGRALAESDVDGIAFTGSAEVGWQLVSSRGPSGLPRPVLAEMGGQNPVIVTESADLDRAAEGIVRSAFGLSGQKCSALRRVIALDSVADELTSKVQERAETLVVGDPIDSSSFMGPLIDAQISRRVTTAIAQATTDGTLVTGGQLERSGYYFSPIVIRGLPVGHPLTRHEIFGPVLTVTAVRTFDDAIAEANAPEYGLSAGVFTRNAGEIERFLDEIEAGVTYVNRRSGATTGAWPGEQTFCGWKLSGSTGKGGLGPAYLPGFMREQSRTIAT